MDLNDLKPGLRVRTTKLGDTRGMSIMKKHLDIRKEGITGTVTGYVGGHGGDVWWVRQDDCNEIGAYVFTEMEPIKVEPTQVGNRVVEL